MSKYLLGVNHARQRRFMVWIKRIIIAAILLGVLIGAVIFIDSILQQRKSDTPSAPTKAESSTVAPSTEIFTSPYFQFQTNNTWKFIANESSSTKFVYRRGSANLVTGDMTIHINSSPETVQATRVLPVVYKQDDFKLESGFTSEHCSKNLTEQQKKGQGQMTLTLNSVRFLCDVDGTNYSVIVGLENATPVMNLNRPDGTNANYIIYFLDLRSSASFEEFEDIMDTFQVR